MAFIVNQQENYDICLIRVSSRLYSFSLEITYNLNWKLKLNHPDNGDEIKQINIKKI